MSATPTLFQTPVSGLIGNWATEDLPTISLNSPSFLTQWVGNNLTNISNWYGGPSSELNWKQQSFEQQSSMWQSDSGETNTMDYWQNAYVVRPNPDGTMNASPKYTSGLPDLTLRKVDAMNSEDNLGPGGEQQPEKVTLDKDDSGSGSGSTTNENVTIDLTTPDGRAPYIQGALVVLGLLILLRR